MELSELIREGRAKVIGLVRQELLSWIKSTEQYEKTKALLRAFPAFWPPRTLFTVTIMQMGSGVP
jgi:hypothetical protein